METAHATLIFVSSLLGPCIAWMAGTELGMSNQRRFVQAASSRHGFVVSPRVLFLSQPNTRFEKQNHKGTGEVRT
jgi:hypothetical protein